METPLGVIKLALTTINYDEDSRKFGIVGPVASYLFEAESLEECKSWVEAIKESLVGLSNISGKDFSRESYVNNVESVRKDKAKIKEGWTVKRGGKKKTWRKRWLVLTKKSLLYYKTKEDNLPQGVITLTKTTARRGF